MTGNTCADCIHFAQWPERVEFARKHLRAAPKGYPPCACMQSPTKALAVAPDDGADCTHFERGDRNDYIEEACDGKA